jgi:hypothetical protein
VPLPQVIVGRPRCVGAIDGTSGGGGLTKRVTAASTAGVVFAVVATVITAIAVFVVVLGPVATGAAVSAIEQVRRRGRRWLGRWGCNVGVEHHRAAGGPVLFMGISSISRSSQTLRKFVNGE